VRGERFGRPRVHAQLQAGRPRETESRFSSSKRAIR
jgi:hypothetical protein